MKKVILVMTMFLAFMSVVSAAGKNGNYNGSPIVKIYNNKVELIPDDVPAIIYEGRTVVPLSILKKIGIGVTWNQTDYSVSIDVPHSNISVLALIRGYASLMDYYSNLRNFTDKLRISQSNIQVDLSYIEQSLDVESYLGNAAENLKNVTDGYSRLQSATITIKYKLIELGISDDKVNKIMKNLESSVNEIKLAVDAVNNYKTPSHFDDYKFHSSEVYRYCLLAEPEIYGEYQKYLVWSQTTSSEVVDEKPKPTPTPIATIKSTPSPTPSPKPTSLPDIAIKQDYMLLYSNDGKTYLGKLTSNQYDSDSIFNDYGSYGGKYSAKSIYNEYGTYGGKYSNESAFNEYASKPPMILLNGKIQGYLTVNSYTSGAVSPLGLKEFLISLGY